MNPVVVVFGCGPAGLIAAHTAREYGASVFLISKPAKSYIAGAQYLHSPVPGLPEVSPEPLRVVKRGTQEGYSEKVYGDPYSPVSWSVYPDTLYEAWNLRALYDMLWDRFEKEIHPLELTPAIAYQAATRGFIESLGLRVPIADAFINAVPLKAICQRQLGPEWHQHQFYSQDVYIKQEADTSAAPPFPEKNYIIYNGEENPSWYRMSYLFGNSAYEWSAIRRKPPVDGIVRVSKPLATDCECFHDLQIPWLRVGRYGSWRKTTLVHDAARDVANFMERKFS